MDQPPAKRSLYHEIQPQHENPDIARLATIGMRIRKSVADGYSVAHEASYNRDFLQEQQQQQEFSLQQSQQQQLSFARVPLPGYVDGPPSLSNQGSTFQSGLNVSEWGVPQMPLNVLPPNGGGMKRRHDDELEGHFGNKPLEEVGHASLEQYVQTYGQLKFDDYSF